MQHWRCWKKKANLQIYTDVWYDDDVKNAHYNVGVGLFLIFGHYIHQNILHLCKDLATSTVKNLVDQLQANSDRLGYLPSALVGLYCTALWLSMQRERALKTLCVALWDPEKEAGNVLQASSAQHRLSTLWRLVKRPALTYMILISWWVTGHETTFLYW